MLYVKVAPLTWSLYVVNEKGKRVDFVFTTGRPSAWLPSTEKACCPVCGGRVRVDKIDVTTQWEYIKDGLDRYIFGLWECGECERRKSWTPRELLDVLA